MLQEAGDVGLYGALFGCSTNGMKPTTERLPLRKSCYHLCLQQPCGVLYGKIVIRTHCDNQAVMAVVNSGYSRDCQVMHLLWCLFFITAKFPIAVQAQYLPGLHNELADAV